VTPAYVTAPATVLFPINPNNPGFVKVKVFVVIVEGFIATLNMAMTVLLIFTPVAPLAGIVEFTLGPTAAALTGRAAPNVMTSNMMIDTASQSMFLFFI
jgi:hypothetical protein